VIASHKLYPGVLYDAQASSQMIQTKSNSLNVEPVTDHNHVATLAASHPSCSNAFSIALIG